ncbi:MAG: transcriptional regulator NrdR [Acidimicrobiales bacterium]
MLHGTPKWSYPANMRCPWCQNLEDKVVDSRLADDGESIRRRRECLSCRRRFTTYERLEDAPLWVIKRSGSREPFEAAKVAKGIRAATKNRPVSAEQIARLVQQVEESLKSSGKEVSYSQIGLAVLDRLRQLDEVAYLRFASVYKNFGNRSDFEREVGLLEKETLHQRPANTDAPAENTGNENTRHEQHGHQDSGNARGKRPDGRDPKSERPGTKDFTREGHEGPGGGNAQ